MGVVIKYSKAFRGIFTSTRRLLDKMNIQFLEDELILRGIDPNRTTYITIRIPSSATEIFEHEPTEEFAIDTSLLKKVLKTSRGKTYIDLSYVEGKLRVEMFRGSVEERAQQKIFYIPSEITEELPEGNKEMKFNVEIDIEPKYLAEMLEMGYLDKTSSMLQVIALKDEEKLILRTENDDGIRYEGLIDLPSDDAVVRYAIVEDSEGAYDLRDILKMIPILKSIDNTTIYFSKEYPIKIYARSGDGIEIEALFSPIIRG